MSKFYKCDICGKEISYGVGDKARGLIYGPYIPAIAGQKACVTYTENSDDIEFKDVCSDCMSRIIRYIECINKHPDGKDPLKALEDLGVEPGTKPTPFLGGTCM